MSKKKCSDCEFDTLGIVTIPTGDWNYCPICSSKLIGITDTEDNKDEDEDMNKIPINSEEEESDLQVEEEDSVEDELNQMEDEELIEDELERLREEIGDDNS